MDHGIRDEMRGATGPGGSNNYRGSFGDWSIADLAQLKINNLSMDCIYELIPSTNSGYREIFCEKR